MLAAAPEDQCQRILVCRAAIARSRTSHSILAPSATHTCPRCTRRNSGAWSKPKIVRSARSADAAIATSSPAAAAETNSTRTKVLPGTARRANGADGVQASSGRFWNHSSCNSVTQLAARIQNSP